MDRENEVYEPTDDGGFLTVNEHVAQVTAMVRNSIVPITDENQISRFHEKYSG